MKKAPMKMKKASSMKLIKKTKTLKGFNKRGKAQYKTTSRTLTNPITFILFPLPFSMFLIWVNLTLSDDINQYFSQITLVSLLL